MNCDDICSPGISCWGCDGIFECNAASNKKGEKDLNVSDAAMEISYRV